MKNLEFAPHHLSLLLVSVAGKCEDHFTPITQLMEVEFVNIIRNMDQNFSLKTQI
ncbi:hypothetical protein LguiA_021914 [Lonicera macranthoides]